MADVRLVFGNIQKAFADPGCCRQAALQAELPKLGGLHLNQCLHRELSDPGSPTVTAQLLLECWGTLWLQDTDALWGLPLQDWGQLEEGIRLAFEVSGVEVREPLFWRDHLDHFVFGDQSLPRWLSRRPDQFLAYVHVLRLAGMSACPTAAGPTVASAGVLSEGATELQRSGSPWGVLGLAVSLTFVCREELQRRSAWMAFGKLTQKEGICLCPGERTTEGPLLEILLDKVSFCTLPTLVRIVDPLLSDLGRLLDNPVSSGVTPRTLLRLWGFLLRRGNGVYFASSACAAVGRVIADRCRVQGEDFHFWEEFAQTHLFGIERWAPSSPAEFLSCVDILRAAGMSLDLCGPCSDEYMGPCCGLLGLACMMEAEAAGKGDGLLEALLTALLQRGVQMQTDEEVPCLNQEQDDENWEPCFEPLLDHLRKRGCSPNVIAEAQSSMKASW